MKTTEEVIIDDTTYIIETYPSGTVVKYIKPDENVEPPPPEPTQEELNNLALIEGIAGLYETQIALEDRMTTDNLTVMEGIAGLFEAQTGGI